MLLTTREVREKKIADRGEIQTESGPRLIADSDTERCSVWGYPFGPDPKPFISAALVEHLRKAHKAGQTTEGFSQAAVRKG